MIFSMTFSKRDRHSPNLLFPEIPFRKIAPKLSKKMHKRAFFFKAAPRGRPDQRRTVIAAAPPAAPLIGMRLLRRMVIRPS
jgi:hypothetical protein